MSVTVEAIYENGVLKPVQALPLSEHEKVRVTVHTSVSRARQTAGLMGWRGDDELAGALRPGSGAGFPTTPGGPMTFADLPQGTSVFVDGNTLVYHFQPYAVFGAACGVPLVGCPFGLWHLRNSGFVPVLYPEGVALHSPGSAQRPWESVPPRSSTPKGLYNPFGVEVCGVGPGPRVRLRDPGLWSATPSG